MGNDKLRNLQILNKIRQAAARVRKALGKFVNEKIWGPANNLTRSAAAIPANVIKGLRRHPGKQQGK